MKPEPFDTTTATEADMRARYALADVIDDEMDPETPMFPFDVWAKEMQQVSPLFEQRRWVVWNDDRSAIVGSGYLGLGRTEENRHLGQFDVDVHPEFRRRGLGRALLREIAAAAADDERTVLGGGTVQGHAAENFLAAVGCTQRLLDRRSRCHIDQVEQSLIDDWIATGAAKAKAAGYSLIFFEPPIPTEYRERFLDVVNTMNDAPRDELDMEDWKPTEEKLADREQRALESGNRSWKMVVRHDATDEFVSFTEIDWHPAVPQVLWQGGTAVKPAHRGHAIGRWIKASMLQKIRTEQPEAEFIDTWNAGSNKWMLAINDDLGFKPYIWYTAWQGSIDDITKAVAG